jgi:NitT/TauT family transport system substrate-binding protein
MSIKMVQGIFKKNMTAIVLRKDAGVKSVADLKGKTITVTAGDAQSNLMPAFLSANKLPADTFKMMAVDGGAKYRLVATGEADGVGSFGAIGIGILQSIVPNVEYQTFDFADSGITVPSFGVIASNDTIGKSPKLVAAFVRATAKGWEDARKDPDAAVEAAFRRFPQAKSRDAEFRKVLRLLMPYIDTPNTTGKPFGWMSPKDWETAEELLVQYAGLKPQPSVDSYFTDAFIK